MDLITCYNVIHGHVDIPFDSFFEFSTHRGTRGHPLKLFYPDPRVSVRAHCFPIRVICFGIVCLLLLYWLKIFTCSKSY